MRHKIHLNDIIYIQIKRAVIIIPYRAKITPCNLLHGGKHAKSFAENQMFFYRRKSKFLFAILPREEYIGSQFLNRPVIL